MIITGINGINFIPLHNYTNSVCYLLVTLHKLHSSTTLNSLLKSVNELDGIVDALMRPLIVYSKLTSTNSEEIYEETRKAIANLYDNFASTNMTKGYTHVHMLICYYLPVIFKLFPNEFVNIVNEIYVQSINLSKYNFEYKASITGRDAFFKHPEHRNQMYEMYCKLCDNHSVIRSNNSTMVCDAIVLEIIDNNINGHVVALINGNNNKFYILDDQFHGIDLEEYYKMYVNKIVKLRIENIDEKSLGKINDILKPYDTKFTIRLRSTVLDNSDKFEVVHSDDKFNDITYTKIKDKYRITGGGQPTMNLFWIILLLIIIMILAKKPIIKIITLIFPNQNEIKYFC